jgi:hypothetical protein
MPREAPVMSATLPDRSKDCWESMPIVFSCVVIYIQEALEQRSVTAAMHKL